MIFTNGSFQPALSSGATPLRINKRDKMKKRLIAIVAALAMVGAAWADNEGDPQAGHVIITTDDAGLPGVENTERYVTVTEYDADGNVVSITEYAMPEIINSPD